MRSRNRLGAVLHVSKSSGNLVLKTIRDVKIGESVTDDSGKKIGVIFDVFGPVNTPYISIKARLNDPESIVGEELYIQRGKR